MARTTPHDPLQASPPSAPHHVPHGPPHFGDEPLYRRIATELLGELRDGAIPPGERLPGERQLAEHFGVSRETVRQALEVLRRDGLVATDRRGSHATLQGPPVETPASLTFPVGARYAGRATVSWESPPPGHAEALALAPSRATLVHRYWSASADGRELRTAVSSFSAVALSEVEELARYRDRADGATAAELRRAYDWLRRAGLTLHHRDTITRIAGTPSVRVTRRVHDQYARPLEITELIVDAQQDALVYEFTLPAAV
ncbi:GntR family transcriptional regulator [Streptomyces sp. NEAU-W12]|uniref:GntR family transcriptional regulator n=1 Tax=Streptomyces sp. NEAU-W12 TaxID=2994668 RepID=UPI00224B085A|nr:GntR family transcriptional regulator [Streptomyces sp. NEAU-W12]MCX2924160.1 GntR family transcriptional regulator [Streptomyces sp. NEAU-W12]